jgi:hypothetical protein
MVWTDPHLAALPELDLRPRMRLCHHGVWSSKEPFRFSPVTGHAGVLAGGHQLPAAKKRSIAIDLKHELGGPIFTVKRSNAFLKEAVDVWLCHLYRTIPLRDAV